MLEQGAEFHHKGGILTFEFGAPAEEKREKELALGRFKIQKW